MAINATEAVRNTLSYALVTDRGSLIKLLERNGVQVPQNPSDRELTASVLMASAKSPNFKRELSSLLTSQVPKATKDFASFAGDNSDFGFTGIDDFSFVGEEEFFNLTAAEIRAQRKDAQLKAKQTKAAAGEKTGVGKFLSSLGQALSSPDTINAGLNIGLTAVNNKVQNRSNAIQDETTVITQKADEVRKDLGKPSGGMSTGTIIMIVVGVAAVAGIVYFVAKKK